MNVKDYEKAEKITKGDKNLMSTVEMVRDFVSDPEIKGLFDRDKLKEESAELRGKEKVINETAKNMLKKNCDINLISEVTNLTISEIKKII